ncbi:monofunctional biosynthetic peptidoglycan transglycosylase [Marinobacter salicampi]|uniref:monofunctional biosynthetic peptidoglycan transglycosylase n=1 Tax=Marinobacter salicampi TaxID=435907 RepID=UPI00140E11CA|nr:monofunctional biosynthetic peptidoglycan transglycosylase [Marinobacter salicampi]
MAKRSFVWGLGRYLILATAGLLAFVAVVLVALRFVNPPTSAFMVAHQLSADDARVRQNWVALEDISRWMPRAVVASEDQRFLAHWGVDVNAIQAALDEYRSGGGLRGASTITQQTAKNLFLWDGRSLFRKSLEALLAVAIDASWSKQRIMEVYLNIAEFGRGIYGVEAASQAFFGISASQLSPQQAARLAAVLPSPKKMSAADPTPYLWQRVRWIQQQMAPLDGF